MKYFLLLFAIIITFINVNAADLYWVGNGGNWSDPNHWSLTSGGTSSNTIPTQNDNVYFDANSFGGGGQTVNIDQAAYCKSMDWTGAATNSSLSGSQQLNIYGSLTLNSSMNVTYTGGIDFKSNDPGNSIQTFGKILSSSISFDGLGGEWTLQDSLTLADGYGIFLNTGALNTNNMTVKIYQFNSGANGIRSLILGSSIINISFPGGNPYNGQYGWLVNGSNLSISSGTSTINMVNNSGGYFINNVSNNLTYYDVNFSGTIGQSSLQCSGNTVFHNVSFADNSNIFGDNTFNNLMLGTSSTTTINGTQTINGTFTCNGTCSVPASLSGGTLKKSSGSVTIDYVRLQGVTATGGAVFTANDVVDFGGNNGWSMNYPPTRNLYWIGNGGNWTDAFHWSLTSGGTSINCIPSPFDNVYFDANSFGGGGQTINIDQTAYCKSMNWTGATHTPTLSGSQQLNIYGSLTLNSSMNVTYTGGIDFKSNDPGNSIQTFGKILSSSISFDGLGGEWTLQDSLTLADGYGIFLNTGALNTNNMTVKIYQFNSGANGIRSLILGSSIINISFPGGNPYNGQYGWLVNGSNLSISSGTSTINMVNNSGGYFINNVSNNLTYYDVNFSGTIGQSSLQCSGNTVFHNVSFADNSNIFGDNTFNNLMLGTSSTTTINGTQTINGTFTCNGTAGSLASISGGTLYKSSGIVCLNYVNITNSTVTGGASFYAGNSQNLGNNNGWLFQSCSMPTLVSLISPGNNSSPGYTISTLTPLFLWDKITSATSYGLQLYLFNNNAYQLEYNNDNITNNSITLPAGTISSGTQYYWQVRAKVNNAWTDYSLPYYFNVSAAALTPIILLSSSSVQTGGELVFTGINFSINNQAKAIITSNNGFDTTITIATNNIGYLTNSLSFTTPGIYNIYCIDINTGNLSNSKSFEVKGVVVTNFNIIFPYSGYKAIVNEPILVEWQDKLIPGTNYPILGSQRGYNFLIDISSDGGNNWQVIDTLSGYDDLYNLQTFSKLITIAVSSSNYLIRIRDGYMNNRNTVNVPIQVLSAGASNLTTDFLWAYSYPTNNGEPVGAVTDGTSRFYIRASDKNKSISQVTFTLFDSVDNNNETRTLGKLMKAMNISTYDTEANNANQLTVTISQPQVNNEFWCWYVAPDDFVGSNPSESNLLSREVFVRITAKYSDGSSNEIVKKITVKRPPVVLVYGLNGTPSTWDSYVANPSFKSKFQGNFTILTIGAQSSFDDNANSILSPFSSASFSIPGVIEKTRKTGFACNQVYYVGHSMGGIILRYAETYYPNNFFIQSNYYKGFINKFITLDTPHDGSPFANILESKLSVMSAVDIVAKLFDINEIDKFYTRGALLINGIQPAIKDLKMNSYNINSTSYKSHVFVGDIINGTDNLASLPVNTLTNLNINLDIRLLLSILYPGPTGLQNLDYDFLSLCGNSISNSDLIVPLNSQLSGLAIGSSLTTYTINFHSQAVGSPSIEMNSADSVAALLDVPISSSVWGNLPALQKISTNFMTKSAPPKILEDTSFITIYAPHNLDTLYIDSLFNLTFSLSDTVNLKKILIIYQDKFIEDTTIQTNYNYTLSVSNNNIDTQKVAILAYYSVNDTTIVSGKTVSVFIKPNSNPTEIKSKDTFVYLLNNEDYDPDIIIYFDKFIGEIGNAGTALNITIADPDILSYNSLTKKITALKGGETSAVVEYRGLKDTVYFKVNGDNIVGIPGGGNNSGSSGVPNSFALYQNYPNPFNPSTVIKYSVPTLTKVTIKIFDLLGREIKTLVDEEKTAGNYEVQFNASNLSSGVYFYRIQAGDFMQTKKLILLK